jgi:uncharacterized protein YndB with AHSA1/START domain
MMVKSTDEMSKTIIANLKGRKGVILKSLDLHMNTLSARGVRAVVQAFRALICIALVSVMSVARADAEQSYAGKVDTGRSISFQVLVQGTPDQIFRSWVSRDGILSFLGSGSNVEQKVGGLYEIDFGVGPNGQVLGPRNNRILRYEPGRALDFEWTMPAFAKEYNVQPLPTWVEVRLEEFGQNGDQTLVRFDHHGFGEGEKWDYCYDFFARGWFDILFRLTLNRTFFVFSE